MFKTFALLATMGVRVMAFNQCSLKKLKNMTGFEIKQKINILKKEGKLFTNCAMWMALEDEKEFACKSARGAVLYFAVEDGVNRGFLSYNDEKSAVDIVSSIGTANNAGFNVVFEWPSREKGFMDGFFSKCGFRKITDMTRMSVADARPYITQDSPVRRLFNKELGGVAVVSDAKKIDDALRAVFDTKVSHLLEKEQLESEIKKGNVFVYFDKGGKVAACLQVAITHAKSRGGG